MVRKINERGESVMKKGLLIVAGVFSLFTLVAQSTFAAWDKPCDKESS